MENETLKDKKCKICNIPLTLENTYPYDIKIKNWNCKPHNGVTKNDIPGVYGIYHNDELVYIGQSARPKKRYYNHINRENKFKDIKENLNLKILIKEEDINKRLISETELISKYKPRLNHPYILLYK